MPRHTDNRIQDLCASALKAKGEEIDSILAGLRSAIYEHVSLARKSLGVQAANIALRDSAALESTEESL